MKYITVIGSGTMGNGIAHVFAQKGFAVTIVDISEEALSKALSTIEKNLNRQVEKGLISDETKALAMKNISTTTFMKEGVRDADLVIEAATENIDLKLKIFRELDENTKPTTILATNTSSISITRIASVTKNP
ncbi:MAG: 3-hydroxyacyl-CoA dehydrogenase NAD-binding domain-containing protein, partial [Cyclobacteriaceae bacterium]|nr:3-hydroxyacyl-CoA dehydrogenase NAD-binding domain-containing protein [Cyclobacteriaceae bacterium]